MTVYERDSFRNGLGRVGGGGGGVGRLRDGYANPRLCFALMIQ